MALGTVAISSGPFSCNVRILNLRNFTIWPQDQLIETDDNIAKNSSVFSMRTSLMSLMISNEKATKRENDSKSLFYEIQSIKSLRATTNKNILHYI
ncbi:hypothetical protein BpHYR1_051225 [Brachionus plicatilis]|uniref:Uncharacterized protein n=1 Tax=Brachionus plicatilis TaxID=10195 RepID=A0A3M7SXJ9_BRAPC|nr:hypothetical protein BpHYR1_051225 [Brachionus plicatilis]